MPDEWIIRNAWIANTPINFANNNLHVVGYSEPVNRIVSREELLTHIHSAVDKIPYVTSYYKRNWGFCCTEETERSLIEDQYFVCIDSELKPGNLNYGELIIPGQEMSEVLLSTYICHPSMANDNLSGIVVLTALAQWLRSRPCRYTYRIVFVPETIGSIAYIAQNDLSNVIAGYVIGRVGHNSPLKVIQSRRGNTLADRASGATISFLDRGSDERQYCSPGVDLPVCSITRGDFPEYHSSDDTLEIISEARLEQALAYCKEIIETLEFNHTYRAVNKCEPQMGERYPAVGASPATAMNVLAYSDGRDLIDLSRTIGVPIAECATLSKQMAEWGYLEDAH